MTASLVVAEHGDRSGACGADRDGCRRDDGEDDGEGEGEGAGAEGCGDIGLQDPVGGRQSRPYWSVPAFVDIRIKLPSR